MKKTFYKIIFVLFFAGAAVSSGRQNKWENVGEMQIPVAGSQAVVLDNKIYILGGYTDDDDESTDAIQVFDPVDGSCRVIAKMQNARSGFIADVYDGFILACGGIRENKLTASSIEIWQPNSASIFLAKNPYLNRINPTGGIYRESLFLIGGYSDPLFGFFPLPYIVEFSLSKKKISFIDELSDETLPYQQSSSFYNGGIYIFGGVYNGVSNKVYKFDISSYENERIYPNLVYARAGAVAVTGNDDAIYLIGGYNEKSAAIDSIEIYHVGGDTNKSKPAQPLLVPRKELTAARFKFNEFDDRIYVFGGKDENDHIVSGIEMLQLSNATTAVEPRPIIARDFDLKDNYPNPFNSSTKIGFNLQHKIHVKLEIYTTLGQLVRTLANGSLMSGHYEYAWDGTDESGQPVATNVYIYRLSGESFSQSKKMILMK
ncbi:MAG: T9SS type A sorting domain-containing protein [Actinobacteria bacterium]|nr:T9SS type A sorting domain-containing protein [Actinomycetota bacterium]